MISNSQVLLSKLLATENIDVVEANCKTASFDVQRRVLTLPIWATEDQRITSYLNGHEVGHAQYTPYEGWHDAVSPRGTKFRNYLNVVEDARIETLIQNRFPGLRQDFREGRRALMEQGFFGDLDRVNDMALIDRLNIHFKLGSMMAVRFEDDEQPFVDRILAAETWEQVETITNDLFNFCKEKALDDQEEEQEEENQSGQGEGEEGEEGEEYKPEPSEADDGEEGEDGEADDGDDGEDGEDGDSEESEEGEESDDGSAGESDDGEPDGDSTGSDADDGEADGDIAAGQKNAKTSSEASKEASSRDLDNVSDDIVPDSETEKTYREKIEQLAQADSNKKVSRIVMPKVDAEKVYAPYKAMLAAIEESVQQANYLPSVEVLRKKTWDEFHSSIKKNVNHMVKEFEQKKAAEAYARTTTSRTGKLDTVKMLNYRTTDDVFLRNTVVTEGKSHGFVMYLDWSGSMAGILEPIVGQVITTAMFCRQVGVPFRVYAFGRSLDDHKFESKAGVNGDMDFSLGLVEFFSEKMSKNEFYKMCMYLYGHAKYSSDNRGRSYYARRSEYADLDVRALRLGGTPLNETVWAALPLAVKFRKETGVEILNTVFLTDGQGYKLGYGNVASQYRRVKLVNPYNLAEYELDRFVTSSGEQQRYTLLEMYKDYTGSNVVDYFVAENRSDYASALRQDQRLIDYRYKTEKDDSAYYTEREQREYLSTLIKEVSKETRKSAYALRKLPNVDRAYIVRPVSAPDDQEEDSDSPVKLTKAQIKSQFLKDRKGVNQYRKMLADMIEVMAA